MMTMPPSAKAGGKLKSSNPQGFPNERRGCYRGRGPFSHPASSLCDNLSAAAEAAPIAPPPLIPETAMR